MNTATARPSATHETPVWVRAGIFAVLALVMAATRVNHFAPVPDASWAVWFVAGFYLTRSWRWVIPALFVEGVLVDYLVISNAGLDFFAHYCMSAAYWFLLPAYLAMWFGGALLARRATFAWRDLGTAALLFFVAFNLCYLVSNGSFYWISDSVPQPRSLAAWFTNLGDWYLPYLTGQAAYFGIAVVLHALIAPLGTMALRGNAATR